MSNSRRHILYILYTMVVGLLFTYLLFPGERVEHYMALQLSRAYPDFSLSIDRVELLFPPGIRLDGASIHHSAGEVLRIEQARVAPKLLSLLRMAPVYVFSGKALDGKFSGRAAFGESKAVTL